MVVSLRNGGILLNLTHCKDGVGIIVAPLWNCYNATSACYAAEAGAMMLTSLILSVLTLHVTMTSKVHKPKENLTFVMMTKTAKFRTRMYTNALRNKARELNMDRSMAWHSQYQLHTKYGQFRSF